MSHQAEPQVRATADRAVRVDQVLVNPETSAHVVIHHQVDDGTTRHVGVFVDDTVVELNNSTAVDWINENSWRTAGRTGDEFGEQGWMK